jgi:SUKH-4 immunity protein of toxin-antitoxin system
MNHLREKIVSFWGDDLKCLSRRALENVPITDYTKEFLVHIGVPKLEELSIDFFTESNVLYTTTLDGVKYIVIGDNIGVKMCIKEDSNEILSIDLRSGVPLRFVNSNIELFLVFVMIYLNESSGKEEIDLEDALTIVDRLRKEYILLDPKALADPNNWWPVILEQVEHGM